LTFCNDDGTLRFSDLDGLIAGQDNPASIGGFLHIEMVSIGEQHRHRDLGVRCAKLLLEFLNVRDARERQEHKAAAETWDRRLEELDGDEAAYIAWLHTRKSERDYLHAGWTVAVLSTGLENTPEDHRRMFERARKEFDEEEAAGGAVGAKRDRVGGAPHHARFFEGFGSFRASYLTPDYPKSKQSPLFLLGNRLLATSSRNLAWHTLASRSPISCVEIGELSDRVGAGGC